MLLLLSAALNLGKGLDTEEAAVALALGIALVVVASVGAARGSREPPVPVQ